MSEILKPEAWELLLCGHGGKSGYLESYCIRQTWVSVPVLPFTSCVILGKLLTLSELEVPYLQNGQSHRDHRGLP